MIKHSQYKLKSGLDVSKIKAISKRKGEPSWMMETRLNAYDLYLKKQMPKWAETIDSLNNLNHEEIIYYLSETDRPVNNWSEVPADIKETFVKLGIPEAEREFLAGVSTQFESEVVYHRVKKSLDRLGVIFTDMDTGLKQHPEIVKKYFGTVIPANDNKYAALNTAVWSGGSFIYVPKGVHVDLPLQAYFRINAVNLGQFERTLIIADEGSDVCYIEGCTSPVYSNSSLHAAVVELIAMANSHIRYTTVQNWSNNVFNLVTKRAIVHENAYVEWVDGNLGSCLTMKYPSVYLVGEGARGDVLSIALAKGNQRQDAGAKAVHLAPNTSSHIISKSIATAGGQTSYRGLIQINRGAKNAKSYVRCDAMLLDEISESDTYPAINVFEPESTVEHEASIGKIEDDQMHYLASRGLSEIDAKALIVNGFINQFTKELPLEYAIELNRLIKLEMEGSVG